MEYYLEEIGANDGFLNRTSNLIFTPGVKVISGTASSVVGIYALTVINLGKHLSGNAERGVVISLNGAFGAVTLAGLFSFGTGLYDSISNSFPSSNSTELVVSNSESAVNRINKTLSRILDLSLADQTKLKVAIAAEISSQVITGNGKEISLDLAEIVGEAGVASEKEVNALRNLLNDLAKADVNNIKIDYEPKFDTKEALIALSLDLQDQIKKEESGLVQAKLVNMLTDIQKRIKILNQLEEI